MESVDQSKTKPKLKDERSMEPVDRNRSKLKGADQTQGYLCVRFRARMALGNRIHTPLIRSRRGGCFRRTSLPPRNPRRRPRRSGASTARILCALPAPSGILRDALRPTQIKPHRPRSTPPPDVPVVVLLVGIWAALIGRAALPCGRQKRPREVDWESVDYERERGFGR